MSTITIFTGLYCNDEAITRRVLEETGYTMVSDADVIAHAAAGSGIPDTRIQNVLSGKSSVFNKFTREKERVMAFLRLAVAEILARDRLLFLGFCGHLIPRDIAHVLKICLIADMKSRARAAGKDARSEKETLEQIHRQDEIAAIWVNDLFKTKDPWNPVLYDMVIPTDKKTPEEIVGMIRDNLASEIIKPTQSSIKAADDFMLACRVEVALAREGHQVDVKARDGGITLTINRNVLMLGRLEQELKGIAEKVEGVGSVEHLPEIRLRDSLQGAAGG
jgi:two-component system, OmpR family, response regulator CpxR